MKYVNGYVRTYLDVRTVHTNKSEQKESEMHSYTKINILVPGTVPHDTVWYLFFEQKTAKNMKF